MLLMPLFVLYLNSALPVNSLIIFLVSFPLSFIGLLLRMNSVAIIDLGSSSIGHHLIVMSDLLRDTNIRAGSLRDIFDQFSLFYLNWFPRELWPSKPIGLGLSIVDYYYGRLGVSETFSISLGLFGEHLFLVRQAWVFSAFTSMMIIALSFRLFRILFGRWEMMYVSLNVWLIAYFWGGSGTFGAYAWFTMAGMPVYYIICSTLSAQGHSVVLRDSDNVSRKTG